MTHQGGGAGRAAGRAGLPDRGEGRAGRSWVRSHNRMNDDCILETRGLTKEFKGFVAVDNVDLEVRRDSIHALIGPNGAGKTTVFNLLTRFLALTRGTIPYEGEDIAQEKPA